MSSKKIRSSCEDADDASCSDPCHSQHLPARDLTITDLPTEVLAYIFHYFSYDDVATQLRPVCRWFCYAATMVLNSGFSTLGPKIERAVVAVENMLQTTSKPDPKALSGASKALDILKSQYRLLRAVTWRYVCNPFDPAPRACFYAGFLLDVFLLLVHSAHTSPSALGTIFYYCADGRSFFGELCDLCMRFRNHFENITEKKLDVDYVMSVAKLVDLLDCLVEWDGCVKPYEHAVRVNKTECHIKTHYRMRHSWFPRLNTSQFGGEFTWYDQQLIYLRLRRLVANNNESLLKQVHHKRQVLLQTSAISVTKAPMESIYCGHGEFVGPFCCYGNISEFICSKGQAEFSHNMDRIPDDFYLDSLTSDDGDNVPNRCSPNMDLQLEIELQCPMELAPIKYLEKCEPLDFEYRYSSMTKSATKGHETEFFSQINIHCPTSSTTRTPSSFQWLVTSTNL